MLADLLSFLASLLVGDHLEFDMESALSAANLDAVNNN